MATLQGINQTEVLTASKDRRGGFWIDPQFQKRYAILFVSLVLLVCVTLIGTFWFHSEQVLKTLSSAGIKSEHSLYQLIERQFSHLLLSAGVVVALFAIFAGWMAALFSHRLVGPIFAIKRSLEALRSGRVGEARIALREDDEFKDVADLVNEVVDSVSSHPKSER